MQNRFAIESLIDDVTDLPAWISDLKNDRINKRDMVRQEQKTARRQILLSESGNAVQSPAKNEPYKIDRALSRRETSHTV